MDAGVQQGFNVVVEQKTKANPKWGIYHVAITESYMPLISFVYVLGERLGYHRDGYNNYAELELRVIDSNGLLRPKQLQETEFWRRISSEVHEIPDIEYDGRYEQYEAIYD